MKPLRRKAAKSRLWSAGFLSLPAAALIISAIIISFVDVSILYTFVHWAGLVHPAIFLVLFVLAPLYSLYQTLTVRSFHKVGKIKRASVRLLYIDIAILLIYVLVICFNLLS